MSADQAGPGDLFPGFESRMIEAGGLVFHARIGGNGSPLLCLHGYPQTHACWHRIAPALAKRHTVVAMDLRGYGKSAVPPGDPAHENYSKRTMACDGVAVMRALGFERFAVIGHDRGARVAYRLALDSPETVERLIALDILPTIDNWERMRASSAISSYHWPFLAQPEPLPETLIAADPVYYLEHTLKSWTRNGSLDAFDVRALDDYRQAIRSPERVHAMCEDYRAGATVDWRLDQESRTRGDRITTPALVLWSSDYLNASKGDFDPIGIWRNWADDVTGAKITSGHFLAEENPEETLAAIEAFLTAK